MLYTKRKKGDIQKLNWELKQKVPIEGMRLNRERLHQDGWSQESQQHSYNQERQYTIVLFWTPFKLLSCQWLQWSIK